MEVIKNLIQTMDGKVESFMKPIIDWIVNFFAQKPYFITLVIGGFLAIVLLAGIIGMLKKARGLFFLLLFLVVAAYCIWFFIGIK